MSRTNTRNGSRVASLDGTLAADDLRRLANVVEARDAADLDYQECLIQLTRKYRLRQGDRIDTTTGAITRAGAVASRGA